MNGRKILLHIPSCTYCLGVCSVLIQCIAELLFEDKKSIRLTRLQSCWHVEKPWQEEMIKFSAPISQPDHSLDSTTVWKLGRKFILNPSQKYWYSSIFGENMLHCTQLITNISYLFISPESVHEHLIEDASPRIWGFHYIS